MATVLLSAAGSALGSSIGGSVLGIGAATLGRAAGAIAGSLIDQAVLGSGSAPVEVGRARSLRLQSSTEGTAIARVIGRMRISGQVIWATRFREVVRTSTQGGKASQPAQTVREYSYTISFAVGLCEGPIERIGRVWADGQLLDLSGVEHRVYLGGEEQLPDPKIEAVEGAGKVPAYRGLAYVVFEDMPLGAYGNRVPQLSFEVYRAPVGAGSGGPRLAEIIEAVCLSPGTGEFALDPAPARAVGPAGTGSHLNINNPAGVADIVASLDQLEADLPAAKTVSLVVSWFGDDLRCGHCRIEPKLERPGRRTAPEAWSVAGLGTATARVISRDGDDRPNFGGTPSDGSVIRAIQEMAARGLGVMFYPFLLMDVPEANGLIDPYGGNEQPSFPWRGRITLEAAPGEAGSSDQTTGAAGEVAAFFGTARAADFTVAPGAVTYSGPAEWGWRRFILHQAALAAAAGGVEAFCIGSELRGITTIRSGRNTFPAVAELVALAAEVRALLPEAKITYAADWSEYFGFQPQDGSGDVLFHLDTLWADPNIDAVGIDDYTPLSDWRHEGGHADEAAGSVYSLDYLGAGVAGGEYFDWYYASDSDRAAQVRTPITDGQHGEPWIFRPKDMAGWWSNAHHDRIGGVRAAEPTAWVPGSKPIWLTETGCPAVDLGSNQPNVFLDDKSSESALPAGSRGARDDEMQRRFLQAKIGYWAEPANNPVGAWGGPMVPTDRIFIWTWDSRPWPDFPVRESVWSDGPAHRRGHWVTGRTASGALSEVVEEICLASGLQPADLDVSTLYGVVDGYLLDSVSTGRQALQPLMQVHGVDAFESGGRIVFSSRLAASSLEIAADGMAATGPLDRVRARAAGRVDAVRLDYVQAESDYRLGAAEARRPGGAQLSVSQSSMQLALPSSGAQACVERWLAEAARAEDRASFALPPSALAIEPGDLVDLPGREVYRIERITDLGPREIEAQRIEPGLYLPTPAGERSLELEARVVPGPLEAVILDLPIADGGEGDHRPWLAVAGAPWAGDVAVLKSDDGERYVPAADVRQPAAIGVAETDLPAGAPGRWQRAAWSLWLPTGAIASAADGSVLNGANRLAVEWPEGWEIVQFREAELLGEDSYRVSGLLRGQRGTGWLVAGDLPAGTRVVVLDDAVVQLPLAEHEVGLVRHWRIGPARYDISHPSFVTLTGTTAGAGLRPFAPAHLRAVDAAGDLAISWVRTTRIGGDRLEGFDVPRGEEHDRYRVRLRAGGAVFREADVEGEAFVWDAAMRAADAIAGPVTIGVARLSTRVGYGPERVIEADV